jgi:hypothetical protein
MQEGVAVCAVREEAEVRVVDVLTDEGHARGHLEQALAAFRRTSHGPDDMPIVGIEHRQVVTEDGRDPDVAVLVKRQAVRAVDRRTRAEANAGVRQRARRNRWGRPPGRCSGTEQTAGRHWKSARWRLRRRR